MQATLHGAAPTDSANSTNTQVINDAGGAKVYDGFIIVQNDAAVAMDGTGTSVAIASGVSRVFVRNRGATTEGILFAWGTSGANAITNLTITAAAATTGFYIPSPADGDGTALLGVPDGMTHYAVCNDTASDTQVVSVSQGE